VRSKGQVEDQNGALGVRVLTHQSNASALDWCVRTLTPNGPNYPSPKPIIANSFNAFADVARPGRSV
jgi:hypothetical protein